MLQLGLAVKPLCQTVIFLKSRVNHALTRIVKFGNSAVSCAKNGWTDRDPVWDSESGMSREHMCYMAFRCPHGGEGTLL